MSPTVPPRAWPFHDAKPNEWVDASAGAGRTRSRSRESLRICRPGVSTTWMSSKSLQGCIHGVPRTEGRELSPALHVSGLLASSVAADGRYDRHRVDRHRRICHVVDQVRSEEGRVRKAWVRTCKFRSAGDL